MTSPLAHWSQYVALRGVAGFVQCFDVSQNLHTAGVVGSVYSRLNPRRRARAERNIALSFPDWPEERVRETAHKSIEHMFQLFLVDALVTPRLITPQTWPRYLRMGNIERLGAHLTRGEPAIFVTAHYGNWELLGLALAVLGYPITALARPLDNPWLNRWVLGIREARGMKILTKWGASTVLPDLLKAGERIGFIADQNAGDGGLFVPFFGRLASSYKSIGLLAMQFEVPIFVGSGRRLDRRLSYEVSCPEIITPDDWVDQPDPLYYITARVNRAMEQMVRIAPDQYLWLHRRWKSRPRHERAHKPMPRRLREKIEALPWMTQGELDRIIELSNDPHHHEAGQKSAATT